MVDNDMDKIRVFFAENFDPWLNLATEDWLFKELAPDQHILYLWRNAPTVVIGKYQNPWNECDLKAMEKDDVKLSRRQSGGGAVYHDLGNTNFTFMSSRNNYSKERNNKIIVDAIASFGVEAEASGRNDIVVEGKKISGSAFKLTGEKAFHHGTLLIDADLTKLPNYLTPDKRKLMAKGIKSVKSRVINLSELNSEITHDSLSQAIIREFFKTYGTECPIEFLAHESIRTIPHLAEYYQLMSDWDWRFGKTPNFNHEMKKRFEWGNLEVHIQASKGIITHIKIFSDCLVPEIVEALQNIYIGCPYRSSDIMAKGDELCRKLPNHKKELCEAAGWLAGEVDV